MIRTKCTIILLLSVICICAACRKEEYECVETQPPEITSVGRVVEQEADKKFYELPEGIQNVMLGDGEFFDVEQDKTFTKDSFQVEIEEFGILEVHWREFVVFDLDQDGEKELIFRLKIDGITEESIRIFDEQDGTVYSYAFVYRAVLEVNDAGMIHGSSGAADFDIYTLEFHGKEYKETVVARSETKGEPDPQYSLRGRMVSEKEFYDFCAQYNQSTVPWERYDDTAFAQLPEGIQTIMHADGEFYDVEQDKTFTKQSFRPPEAEAASEIHWWQYIICDLDHDGQNELLFQISDETMEHFVNNVSIRMFDEKDGMVSCYTFDDGITFFGDGVCYDRNSVLDCKYYLLNPQGKSCNETILAQSISEETKGGKTKMEYMLGGKRASEKDYNRFADKYLMMDMLEWIEYY